MFFNALINKFFPKEGKSMKNTEHRLFVSGPRGYISAFKEVFLSRRAGAGFLEAFVPMPKEISKNPDGNVIKALYQEQIQKEWRAENWGIQQDFLFDIDKGYLLRDHSMQLLFDFSTGGRDLPTTAITHIAYQYPHLQFELYSCNKEENFENHLAYRYGNRVRNKLYDYSVKESDLPLEDYYGRYTGPSYEASYR